MSPAIVPATRDLLEQFYGHPQSRSVRALAAVLDGKPICVAGVHCDGARYIAFAEITPLMREKYPLSGMRMARRVMQMIRDLRVPVYTAADCRVEAAHRFLEHLGFARKGEVYAWAP